MLYEELVKSFMGYYIVAKKMAQNTLLNFEKSHLG